MFPTIEAAVAQGKQDLISLLESQQPFDVGLSLEAVQRSQPGKPITRYDIDFQRLLAAKPESDFSQVAKNPRSVVVPLLDGAKPVTVVELSQAPGGFRLAALTGRDVTSDLASLANVEGRLALYEVPNLQARAYGVATNGTELFYTDYEGKFSLREPVSGRVLLDVLRADALEFERLYGERLKRERLVR